MPTDWHSCYVVLTGRLAQLLRCADRLAQLLRCADRQTGTVVTLCRQTHTFLPHPVNRFPSSVISVFTKARRVRYVAFSACLAASGPMQQHLQRAELREEIEVVMYCMCSSWSAGNVWAWSRLHDEQLHGLC